MKLTMLEINVLFNTLRDTMRFFERKDGGSFTYDRKTREELLIKMADQMNNKTISLGEYEEEKIL